MKFFIIGIISFMLLIPTAVFGTSDGYYEYDYGKQMYQSPTVCLIQPNDPRVTEQKWNNWYSDMKPAIDTWRTILQSSGSGNWEITTVNVPLDKLDLLNYSKCNIQVNFVQSPNNDYQNYFGMAYIGNGLIEIVYFDSYVCGNKYDTELDIFVNTYCLTNNMNRSKQMANTLQHEFGHMIGLGHYRGYDQSSTQEWYDGEKGSPSIMAWIEPNEEMRQVSQIDVSKIREIYGTQGFGEKIESLIPIFNEPYIPEPVVEVSGRGGIHLSEGETSTYVISGNVPDKLYKRGEYLEIIIQKPDGTTEYKATTVSKTLKKFNHNLNFNYSDLAGKYKITLKFDGTIFDKKEIQISKDSSKSTSNTNIKSASSIDQDNDGIIDSKDLCNTKPETYNGYKDTDGCPDIKPTSSEKNQSEMIKQEVQDLQIFSYDKIDSLKNRMESSKRTLEKLSPNNSEQKDKLNQAWNLLKNSQAKLKEIESRVQKGDTQLGYEEYENAKTFFTNNEKISEKLGKNLEEISKLIENVKPQSCFLIWCW